LPFYHPAAALRQGVVMDAFIKDFTKIPKILKYIDSQQELNTISEMIEDTVFA